MLRDKWKSPVKNPVLVCNVGWMDRYEGLQSGDKITGGGSYVRKKGYGDEIYNFASYKGSVYGGVFPVPNEWINVQKLNGGTNAERADHVTVIWCASHLELGGSYVVGWFKNASVYADWQKPPVGSRRFIPGARRSCGFYVKARASDAHLLGRDERLIKVPRGRGGIGNSNIWFPELTSVGRKFLTSISGLLSGKKIELSKKIGFRGGWQSDWERRETIESLAMDSVAEWYEDRGYTVTSVATQNVGWDLEASLRSGSKQAVLRIEVKGLSGNQLCVELTPNEFAKMNYYKDSYRLCVVTEAEYPKKQKIHRFGFSPEASDWKDQVGTVLRIRPLTGARCSVR